MNPNQANETVRNGVNVTRLGETIKAATKQPEIAAFRFRAKNRWKDGSQNQATIDNFHGVCQELRHEKPIAIEMDEPPVLLGQDKGANPVELVLAGLSGCMTTTLAYHAASRGHNIQSITSEYEGDIDLRGLLDIDPKARKGYREIRVKFRVQGDIDEATVRELVQKSPVFDTLAQPVAIKIDVEKA